MHWKTVLGLIALCLFVAGCSGNKSTPIAKSADYKIWESKKGDKDNLPFEMKYGEKALKISERISTASCKEILLALYDGSAASVKLVRFSSKKNDEITMSQRAYLDKQVKKFVKIIRDLRDEDKKRCSS